jgi:hypothetical protein
MAYISFKNHISNNNDISVYSEAPIYWISGGMAFLALNQGFLLNRSYEKLRVHKETSFKIYCA